MAGLCPAGIIDVSHAGDFLDKFSELYLDSFLANIMVGVLLGAANWISAARAAKD